MRSLSALGFVVSFCGILLVFYNQFAVIPFLSNLNENSALQVNDFTISLRVRYEVQLHLISTICIIVGVFSVLFCSFLYLRKRTRMTFVGTIFGLIVAIMGIIHSWY